MIFHDTTFEAMEAQRIPHAITSNRGVDLLTPQLLLAFILQAHVQQREPPELVHKIHPFPGISLLKLKKKIIYFWLLWVFGTVQVFLCCSEQGLPFIAVGALLTVQASFVAEHGAASVVQAGELRSCSFRALEQRLRSCSTWAYLLHSM